MLLRAGVIPVIVFDGGKLPMKRGVEDARRKSRALHKAEGDQLWKEGQADLAVKKYAEAIDITSEIAHEFILALRQRRVEYIVAPYEADAQMAFLFHTHYVSLVITEDSDLLAFGCDRVLFKLDNEGYGDEIDLRDLSKATELDYSNFDKEMLLKTCILGGCDYLRPIKGIGFKKAYKYMADCETVEAALVAISKESKNPVPAGYRANFEKAYLTFKFQTVFDPVGRTLTYLNPLKGTIYKQIHKYKDKTFLGAYLFFIKTNSRFYDAGTARRIAEGEIDPVTFEPFEDDTEEKELAEWAVIQATTVGNAKENLRSEANNGNPLKKLGGTFQFKLTRAKNTDRRESPLVISGKRKAEEDNSEGEKTKRQCTGEAKEIVSEIRISEERGDVQSIAKDAGSGNEESKDETSSGEMNLPSALITAKTVIVNQ